MRYGAAPVDARPLVTVIVPVYDEAPTIERVTRELAALPLRTEIIVVDDGSRDATPTILARVAAELDGCLLYTSPSPRDRS